MRGKQNGLRFEGWIGTGHASDNIHAFKRAQLDREMPPHLNSEGNRPKGLPVREREQFVQGLSRLRRELPARFLRDPSGEFEAGLSLFQLQSRMFSLRGTRDDTPPVAGRRIGVDDERRHSAATRCLFELVCPAAIVGKRRLRQRSSGHPKEVRW